jgi:hypothetical protein
MAQHRPRRLLERIGMQAGTGSRRAMIREAAAMRRYTFRALVMLDPAAREDAAGCGPGGMLACCLVEPSHRVYFPAVISLDSEGSPQAKAHALVAIALHDSEAGAFFAPGQRFTIWANAIVGHSVQPAGLAGSGAISQCLSPPAPRALGGETARKASPARVQVPGGSSLAGRA